jgi:hypothetical protein
MPLTQAQKKWLQDFVGSKALRTASSEADARREAALALLQATLTDEAKAQIQAGGRYELVAKGSRNISRSSRGEVESREINQGFESVDAEVVTRAHEALARVHALRDQLLEEMIEDEQGKRVPLFRPEEVVEEVYTSAVREHLVPENSIPDAQSAVARRNAATNALFVARQTKYAQEAASDAGESEATEALKSTGHIAASIADVVGAEMAKDITELVTLALTTSVSAGNALSKRDGKALATSVTEQVSAVVKKGVQTFAGEETAALVTGVASAMEKFVAGAYKLGGTKEDRESALEDFGEGLFEVLGAASETQEGSVRRDLDIAAASTRAILKSFAASPRLVEAVRVRNYEAIAECLGKIAESAVDATFRSKAAVAGEDDGDDAREARREALEERLEEVTAINTAVTGTTGLLGKVLRSRRPADCADELWSSVGDSLGLMLQEFVGDEEAATVGMVFKSASTLAEITRALKAEPPDYAALIASVADTCGAAVLQTDPSDDGAQFVAESVTANIKVASSTAEAIRLFNVGDYDEAVVALSTGVKEALGKSLRLDLDEPVTDEDVDEASDEEERTGLLQTQGVQEGLADAESGAQETLAQFKAVMKSAERRTTVAAEGAEAEARARLRDLTDEEGLSAQAYDARSINVLIKTVAKDRALIQMAAKVASGGAKVAEAFFAPMAAAGAAVRFIEAIQQAAQRLVQLNAWAATVEDAEQADSGFSPAARNFVRNQRDQLSHHTIVAALELTQMMGSILSSSGVGIAAGEIISKSAVAAKVTSEVLYKYYQKSEVSKAWAVTRQSLADPKNRRLAAQVRALNPTMAKYVIAYGAVEERDPIARAACAACNLSAAVLNHPDAGVEEVQQYLEVFYAEDNVILQADQSVKIDWIPDPVTLELKVWAAGKRQAIAHGLRESEAEDTSAFRIIEGGMLSVSDARRTAGSDAASLAAIDVLIEALTELGAALAAFAPKNKALEGGRVKEHPGMLVFLGKLSDACARERSVQLQRKTALVERAETLKAARARATGAATRAADSAARASAARERAVELREGIAEPRAEAEAVTSDAPAVHTAAGRVVAHFAGVVRVAGAAEDGATRSAASRDAARASADAAVAAADLAAAQTAATSAEDAAETAEAAARDAEHAATEVARDEATARTSWAEFQALWEGFRTAQTASEAAATRAADSAARASAARARAVELREGIAVPRAEAEAVTSDAPAVQTAARRVVAHFAGVVRVAGAAEDGATRSAASRDAARASADAAVAAADLAAAQTAATSAEDAAEKAEAAAREAENAATEVARDEATARTSWAEFQALREGFRTAQTASEAAATRAADSAARASAARERARRPAADVGAILGAASDAGDRFAKELASDVGEVIEICQSCEGSVEAASAAAKEAADLAATARAAAAATREAADVPAARAAQATAEGAAQDAEARAERAVSAADAAEADAQRAREKWQTVNAAAAAAAADQVKRKADRAAAIQRYGGMAKVTAGLKKIRDHQKGKIDGFFLLGGKHPSGKFALYASALDDSPVLLVSSSFNKDIDPKYIQTMAALAPGDFATGLWVQRGEGAARTVTVSGGAGLAATFGRALEKMRVQVAAVIPGTDASVKAIASPKPTARP